MSVRSPDDLYYASELPGPETTIVHSRVAPPDSLRPPGRLTAADLPWPLRPDTTAYICGSAGFCDTAGDLLVGLGMPVAQIRVERFGPTG